MKLTKMIGTYQIKDGYSQIMGFFIFFLRTSAHCLKTLNIKALIEALKHKLKSLLFWDPLRPPPLPFICMLPVRGCNPGNQTWPVPWNGRWREGGKSGGGGGGTEVRIIGINFTKILALFQVFLNMYSPSFN